MRSLKITVAFSSFITLTACGHLSPGVASIPQQVVTQNNITAMSKKYTSAAKNDGTFIANSWLEKSEQCSLSVSANAANECQNYRNGLISEIMLIIDYNYHSYEGNLLAGRAKSDFYFDTARTALETASTLFVPTDTKSILSALATASGTVKDSADASFYFKQTGPALIGYMRADRQLIEAEIIEGSTKPYRDYPIASAMRDLAAFYRAGTMASAISSLNKSVGPKQEEAKEELDKAKALR